MNEITLGCRAKDRITGFCGIVVAITNWLNGCVRMTIQPEEVRDGKRVETETFDVEQVEYIDAGIRTESKPSGGDRENIRRAKDPR